MKKILQSKTATGKQKGVFIVFEVEPATERKSRSQKTFLPIRFQVYVGGVGYIKCKVNLVTLWGVGHCDRKQSQRSSGLLCSFKSRADLVWMLGTNTVKVATVKTETHECGRTPGSPRSYIKTPPKQ